MKAHILNPLAFLGLKYGYNRPLDRSDFEGGKIPGWAGCYMPGVGETRRFTNLSGVVGDTGMGIDTFSYSTDQKHPLGTIACDKIGRQFRYVQAGAVALVAGNAIQSSAVITAHFDLTSAAQAIGDGGANAPIVVTPGATAGAANLYAEGLLFVTVTPDLGHAYRISGHAAITASTAFNLILDPDDRIQVAFTSSTRYNLLANPYKSVIQFPVTTATGTLVGIAVSPIAIANYGWVQTRGIGAPLIAGTPALGAMIMSPGTTAGASVVVTTTNLVVAQFVGRMAMVGVAGATCAVALDID